MNSPHAVSHSSRVTETQVSPYIAQPPVRQARRLNAVQFRVLGRTDKLNRAGRACSRLELGNLAGSATALIEHDRFLPCHRDVVHGDVIMVTGELQQIAERCVIVAEELYRPTRPRLMPTALLPKDWALPVFQPALRAVIRHWMSVSNPALQLLLKEVFLDSNAALGFLNVPASLRYHHAYQGGLLDHTADMLERFCDSNLSVTPGIQRDLVLTLVILHDLGKTVTLVGNGRSSRGACQPHELAAIELMAAPLAQLEMTDSNLANHLRGYFKPRDWYPRSYDRIYKIVAELDRQSANMRP